MPRRLKLLQAFSLLALAAWALCPPAHAARPLVTDDARLTNAHSCQLESWTRLYDDRQEQWALPACNLTGNLELTIGGGFGRAVQEATTTRATGDVVLQAKTLLRPIHASGDGLPWGMGLAVGSVLHPSLNPGPNGHGSLYAYVPLSVMLGKGAVVLHGNAGWVKARGDTHAMSWGLGSETRLTQRLTLVAESFGDPRKPPYWQAGLRYFILPDRVQVDATMGDQIGGNGHSRWISVGLRLTPGRLF